MRNTNPIALVLPFIETYSHLDRKAKMAAALSEKFWAEL